MSKKIYGDLEIRDQKSLKLADSDSSNYVNLKAPATLSADYSLTLPTSDGNADELMSTDGSGVLSFIKVANANVAAGAAIAYSKLALTGSIVDADINASAAIAYSKLSLTGSIVNADVNASAAIAYSKLNLSASIVNADIASGAAIALSKLASLTADRALQSSSGGVIEVSAVTSTELGYVSGVTSAIQTQLNGKVSKSGDSMSGNLVLENQKEVRFSEATGSGSNYTGIKAAGTIASDHTYTLPAAFPASSGYHLASDTSGVMSWAPAATVAAFKANWANADGTSKTITHSLGSTDVMVQIFDSSTGESIEVDTEIRTDGNTLDLTASSAPAVSWRVLILAI